jgi:Protein of unknown function (DUF1572)
MRLRILAVSEQNIILSTKEHEGTLRKNISVITSCSFVDDHFKTTTIYLAIIMIESLAAELQKYKSTGAKTLAQISDEGLNFAPAPDQNSIAILVRHLHGNLHSRFTDFLTTDGEKSWRDRTAEFSEINYTHAEVELYWTQGWEYLESALAELSEEDLSTIVTIKGKSMTAEAALLRTLAHIAYHVGQIVFIARMLTAENWQWITAPRKKSFD